MLFGTPRIKDGGGGSSLDLGYFATPAALILAYPVGTNGNFAIVGSTDTIWVWDSGTGAWVDTGTTATDIKFKVSAADTTTDYGVNKIVEGYGIDVNLLSPGGAERLEINNTLPGVIPSREIVINTGEPAVAGKQYPSFLDAFAWLMDPMLNPATPSSSEPWTVRYTGNIIENILVPEWVSIVGDNPENSQLQQVSFVSDSSAGISGNNITNSFINDLYISGTATPTPDISVSTLTVGQTEDNLFYSFDSTPTSGTYDLDINGNSLTTIAYNESAANIQTLIRAIGTEYGSVSVLGDYTTGFTIYMSGLPTSLNTFSVTNNTDATGITASIIPGAVGQSTIVFTGVPTAGDWRLQFLYNSVQYFSNTLYPFSTWSDVQAEAQNIFGQILIAESIDLGTTTLTVSGDYANGFMITYLGAPGNLNNEIFSPDPDPLYYTVTYDLVTEKYANIDNCIVRGSTQGVGACGLTARNTRIIAGDYSHFTGYCTFYDSVITGGSMFSPVYMPTTLKCYNCSVSTPNNFGLVLSGGNFYNTDLYRFGRSTINAGDYNFYNSHIDGSVTMTAAVNFNLISSSLMGQATVDFGSVLNTWGSVVTSVSNTGGTYTNLGDAYDPTISGLASTEVQGAIDELATKAGANPSREVVINIYDSEVVGKQYSTFANAFTYIATQIPSELDTWTVRFTGYITEDLDIPEHVTVCGDGPDSSIIDGTVTFVESGTTPTMSSNNLINCTVTNLNVTDVVPAYPVTYSEGVQSIYTPDAYTFTFDTEPTTGTYQLDVDGTPTAAIAYNATNTDVQNAIIALGTQYAGVTVSGDYTTSFSITMGNLPAGMTTLFYTDIDTGVTATTVLSLGSPEVDYIMFNEQPTAGTFVISLLYSGTTYYSNTLNYDATAGDVLTEIQFIFTQIQTDWSVDLGIATVTVDKAITYPYSVAYTITLTGAPGALLDYFIIDVASYAVTTEQGTGKYVNLDNTRVINSTTGLGNNGLVATNSIILGGDYQHFSAYFTLINTTVIGINGYPTIYFPIAKTNNCILSATGVGKLQLKGGTFYNTQFSQMNKMGLLLGTYSLHECAMDGNANLISGIIFSASCSSHTGKITVAVGASLLTKGCHIANIDNNGSWTNQGDRFNPAVTSYLVATNMQSAIDELSLITYGLTNTGILEYDALLSQDAPVLAQTSGVVKIGQTWTITTYVAGDDFSNWTLLSGTGNTSGDVYLATSITPNVWTNSSILTYDGAPYIVSTDAFGNLVPFKNTLSGDIVWTYVAAGLYDGTLTGQFLTGKTFITSQNNNIAIIIKRFDDDTIKIYTNSVDAILDYTSIQIKVYP